MAKKCLFVCHSTHSGPRTSLKSSVEKRVVSPAFRLTENHLSQAKMSKVLTFLPSNLRETPKNQGQI